MMWIVVLVLYASGSEAARSVPHRQRRMGADNDVLFEAHNVTTVHAAVTDRLASSGIIPRRMGAANDETILFEAHNVTTVHADRLALGTAEAYPHLPDSECSSLQLRHLPG